MYIFTKDEIIIIAHTTKGDIVNNSVFSTQSSLTRSLSASIDRFERLQSAYRKGNISDLFGHAADYLKRISTQPDFEDTAESTTFERWDSLGNGTTFTWKIGVINQYEYLTGVNAEFYFRKPTMENSKELTPFRQLVCDRLVYSSHRNHQSNLLELYRKIESQYTWPKP